MQSDRTRWRGVLERSAVPCDLLSLGDQIKARSRESWGVQNLANVAGRLRTVVMRVEKCQARCDVKQQRAAQYS
jgi:hypothetical protein